ncbi:5-oxoprolinase/urea amidolyase family protein [Ornithinibacillus sp. L9]|uniref:5-oxoprolinase/urea amidolyase family protein n=1 Tax=Ornithinibacillus caprae TaxID=2678566 RepID=A0A6N8FHA7_9BACI|nr:biotin-dependent carboxyltransferase family protein [Ornithinibacillus caprae]MUK89052.1 5-oxoprolinase/urea amidolyase family protein [Ornithinibacillus caprae]
MASQQIFHVVKPGLMTTYQDMGRVGYQRFGVPVSGAMDRFSLQIANILVGNRRDEACLEVALIGPELVAGQSMTIAITGADLEPKVNGQPKRMWTSFRVEKGDRLTFGQQHAGVYAYIAVAGGFDCPTFLGSKSTDVKSGFGSPLEKQDNICGNPMITTAGVGIFPTSIPTYPKHVKVGVIEGPHTELFSHAERKHFYDKVHTLEANSNRMGYRLRTDTDQWKSKTSIWSDAVPIGAIQIPPNGQPIILMADRQTTGGYPRIGTVISSDLPKVAQLIPRGKISFYPISVDKAQQYAIAMEKYLRKLTIFRKYIH